MLDNLDFLLIHVHLPLLIQFPYRYHSMQIRLGHRVEWIRGRFVEELGIFVGQVIFELALTNCLLEQLVL